MLFGALGMAGTITATSQCQDGTEAHNNPSIGSDVRELDLTSSRADCSPQVAFAAGMRGMRGTSGLNLYPVPCASFEHQIVLTMGASRETG